MPMPASDAYTAAHISAHSIIASPKREQGMGAPAFGRLGDLPARLPRAARQACCAALVHNRLPLDYLHRNRPLWLWIVLFAAQCVRVNPRCSLSVRACEHDIDPHIRECLCTSSDDCRQDHRHDNVSGRMLEQRRARITDRHRLPSRTARGRRSLVFCI